MQSQYIYVFYFITSCLIFVTKIYLHYSFEAFYLYFIHYGNKNLNLYII